jgi:uncharacterized protein (TIGR03000 family)
MRKMFCILGLVAITLIASANDAFAQRIRIGGRRGGVTIDNGSGSYYGDGYRSSYYDGYRSPYYGRGYNYNAPYYYGGRYYYTPEYSYSTPSYSYWDSGVQPAEYQSFYSDPNAATITVLVPNADTQVWFDDAGTSQRGMERVFTTPALKQAGTYTIKARWTENGRTVDRQREVRVQPGQSATVNFRVNPSETVPAPLPGKSPSPSRAPSPNN